MKQAKQQVKDARTSHDLHVLLIMNELGLSKPDATALAYIEGAGEHAKRLK